MDTYARKLAFSEYVADLMADDTFADGLPRTDDGEVSIIIGDWDDTLGDVFKHLDHVEAPASLLLPRGDSILQFVLDLGEDSISVESVAYDPDRPLRDFLVHVIENGKVALNFSSELPTNTPYRQLILDLKPAA